MITDSHCHLDHFDDAELGQVVERARAAGVGRMVTIGTRAAQAARVKAIAERFPEVWGTVGVHPQHVGEAPLAEVADLVALADHPRIIGIGESGLDYHYDTAPRDVQAQSFRQHIRAARQTGLPLVIHARAADEDILAILREEWEQGPFVPLLHCFSSGRALAEVVVSLGGYVSFSGILTFPKSQENRMIAAGLPLERLLVETDAPYLAPAPHRGRRNEPAYVARTAAVLADLRGVSVQDIGRVTSENFERLFMKTS